MNFCTEVLGTIVTIEDGRVEEEGYEVSNLLRPHQKSKESHLNFFTPIDSESEKKNEGFMSARFSRAPVTIKLEFPVPIHISHIVLGPKIRDHVSSGFIIKSQINSYQIKKGASDDSLEQVSREFINDMSNVPDLIVFRNPRFKLNKRMCHLPNLGQFESHRNHIHSFELHHPSYNSCERVFSLYITIARTQKFSVPVIKFLEIWAQPSKWNTFEQVERLIDLWTNQTKRDTNSQNLPTQTRDLAAEDNVTSSSSLKRKFENDKKSDFEIPEEFLDPITYEIMTQPIRLPCGIAIDNQTLVKYYKEEANWGRPENDPFTGRGYSSNLYPLPDASLKARIDSFLTQNANRDVIKNIPRTLGTASYSKRQNLSTENNSKMDLSCNLYSNTESTSGVLDNSIDSKKLTPQELMQKELSRILDASPITRLHSHSHLSKDHSSHAFHNKPILSCSKCSKNMCVKTKDLYATPCHHSLFCRECLVGVDKSISHKCPTCHLSWSVKDLTKVYNLK